MKMHEPLIHKPIGDAVDTILRTAALLPDPKERLEVLSQATALLIGLTERSFGKTSTALSLHRARKTLAEAVKANAQKKG